MIPTILKVSGSTKIFCGARSLWQSTNSSSPSAAVILSHTRLSRRQIRDGGNTGSVESTLPIYPRRRRRNCGRMSDSVCASTASTAAPLTPSSTSNRRTPYLIRVISRCSNPSLLLYSLQAGTGIVVLEEMNWSVAASLRRRSWGHQGNRILPEGRRGREVGGRSLFTTVCFLTSTQRPQVV